jgi:hypothetical protein
VQYSLLTDQLGSTSVVTDQSGAEKARRLYRPCSDSGTLLTDRQFTGQRSEEAGLGPLYDCNAYSLQPVLFSRLPRATFWRSLRNTR